jgi:hypothetical protein
VVKFPRKLREAKFDLLLIRKTNSSMEIHRQHPRCLLQSRESWRKNVGDLRVQTAVNFMAKQRYTANAHQAVCSLQIRAEIIKTLKQIRYATRYANVGLGVSLNFSSEISHRERIIFD